MKRTGMTKLRATVLVVAIAGAGSMALVVAAAAALSALPSHPSPSSAAEAPATVAQVATNPFNVEGPSPGRRSELAVPQLWGEVRNVGLDEFKRVAPRAGRLAPSDAANLGEFSASIVTGAEGKFFAQVAYGGGERGAIRVESWTPDGPFTLRAPTNSPVAETKQTTIAGHPALTTFPTSAVVGRKGPRDVYVEVNGVYYSILAYWLTSDADMIAFVERLITEVSK